MAETSYTVRSGDSLSAIARAQLGDLNRWPEIARLNNIASPYTIRPGQVLRLPGPTATPPPPAAPTGATPAPTVDPVARLDRLTIELRAIAAAMVRAKAAGDVTRLEQLRVQFRDASARADALRDQLSGRDQPPQVLQALDRLGDQVVAVAREAGEAAGGLVRGAGDVLGGLGSALKFLPLIVGLLVAGLVTWAVIQAQRAKRAAAG